MASDEEAFEEAAALLQAVGPAAASDEHGDAMDAAFGELAALVAGPKAEPAQQRCVWQQRSPALLAFARMSRAAASAGERAAQLQQAQEDVARRSLLTGTIPVSLQG